MADNQDKKTLEDIIALRKQNLSQIEREIELRSKLNSAEKERLKLNREFHENERAIRSLLELQDGDLNEINKEVLKLENRQKEIIKILDREEKRRRTINTILKQSNVLLREGWKYLMESDKVIKSTILNLGMSGAKADMMRDSFESSAQYVARLGGVLTDVSTIMEGYADTTGRARALSEETVKSVMQIGKGTALGVEEATRLASQFEFMGKDARTTMEYVQGVVDTSERMGVNTSKVLKDVSTNFKKLSTFTFQRGTKAFAEMAIDAERTRVSMETALNVAEATRGLETVIELGANLQVMGGEFAKMDPLHWMYTVRNEPEQLNKMISDMTKGLFTLRQTSDGTFERFISPADRDRLANVAKTLGISNEEMFQIAQRSSELSSIQRDLSRLGLSEREKALVEGAAQFNSETGKMQVRLGRHMQDITKLTSEQTKSFITQQETLEERAKAAMTFDDVWRNTINELKSTLLPLLEGINTVLSGIRKIIDPLLKGLEGIENKYVRAAIGGGVLAAGGIGKSMIGGWWSDRRKDRTLGGWGGIKGKSTPNITDTRGMVTNPKTGIPIEGATKARDIGVVNRMKAAGTRNLKTGAGVGAAGLGIGAGIGAGAMGIAQMAKAFKELNVEQIKELNKTMVILGSTMAVVGALGLIGAKGLFAVGVAALSIGAGIGIAAAGIGYMTEGLGNMIEKAKGGELRNIAGGIAAIAGATMLFANPLNLMGLGTLTATMGIISATNISAANAAKNIANMATSMSGTKDDFLAVEKAVNAINSMDRKNANIFSDLAKIMNKPLKVQLDDSSVTLKNDVTLEIDKNTFMNKIFDSKLAVQLINRQRINKR